MKNLLRDAAAEIRRQRRELEILRGKVEMIDLFACVLHTKPASQSIGAGECVAWKLEQEAHQLEKQEEEAAKKEIDDAVARAG